jgi:hypothetical protein
MTIPHVPLAVPCLALPIPLRLRPMVLRIPLQLRLVCSVGPPQHLHQLHLVLLHQLHSVLLHLLLHLRPVYSVPLPHRRPPAVVCLDPAQHLRPVYSLPLPHRRPPPVMRLVQLAHSNAVRRQEQAVFWLPTRETQKPLLVRIRSQCAY